MKNKRSLISAALLGAMLLSVPVAASAATTKIAVESKPITMQFDGKTLALPAGQIAFMYQSKVYIPLRFASYALQKQVEYDPKTKMVSVVEPSSAQLVALKEYLENAASLAGTTPSAASKVQLVPTAVKLVFDGVEKKLPTGQQAFNVNGSIYVPVRFMSEAVGTTVLWDSKTGTVSGESKAYRDMQANGSNGNTAGSGSGTGNGSNSETTSGNSGSTGGGSSTQPAYESITSNAYSQLDTLKTSCTNSMISIALQYKAAANQERKDALEVKANDTLSACTAKFESIMSDTEAKLNAGGYSKDILKEYRAAFESTLEEGKKYLQALK